MPVRVSAGAFGPGLPIHDLRLSPDHAVYVDGVLIPIRYLLNGDTILQERAAVVTYFHVELDQHGIILADGLPCETYLDPGNRAAFENGGTLVQANPDFALRIWETESCATLVVAGPHLAAIKTRLLHQGATLGHGLTEEPDVHLIVDGNPIRPTRDGRHDRFAVPADVHVAQLASRHFVPAQMFPTLDDPRRLGVAITGLNLDGRATALDDPRLADGWHSAEASLRWTDGDAGLVLTGVRDLAFDVAMVGQYWLQAIPMTGAHARSALVGRM